MTRKRSVEMVVMRKNIQNSQRSTYLFQNEKERLEEPTIDLFILDYFKKMRKIDRLGKHLPLSPDVVVPSLKFPDTGLAFGENGTLVKI